MEIHVYLVDENDTRKDDDQNVFLKVFQTWWYPDHKGRTLKYVNGVLFPIYISRPENLVYNVATKKLQSIKDKYPNVKFIFDGSVSPKLLSYLNINVVPPKQCAKAFAFAKIVNHKTNIPNTCLRINGFLSSGSKVRHVPKFTTNTQNAEIIVSEEYAISFSRKKRLYCYQSVEKLFQCRTNEMFFDCRQFLSRPFEGLHIGETWMSCIPKIEHILMLKYFGIFLKNVDASYLDYLKNDIWTIILLFLLSEFKTTCALPTKKCYGTKYLEMQNAIQRISNVEISSWKEF